MASGKKPVNGVDLYYEQTGRGKHAVLLLPGALGKYKHTPPFNVEKKFGYMGRHQNLYTQNISVVRIAYHSVQFE